MRESGTRSCTQYRVPTLGGPHTENLGSSKACHKLVKLTSLMVVTYFDKAFVNIDKVLVKNSSVVMGINR